MGKGMNIPNELDELIARIHSEHRDWGPRAVTKELHKRMKFSKYNYFPPDSPREGAVGNRLREFRKRDIERPLESKRLDSSWSLASLVQYPIPPEALPTVMSFYKKRLAEDDVLTIRDALWTARLYKLVDPSDSVTLMNWVVAYSIGEWVSEITGEESFDSQELDLQMAKDIHSTPETVREIEIWRIAEKYGADFVKLMDLNLSIEETEEIAKSGKYKKGGKTK